MNRADLNTGIYPIENLCGIFNRDIYTHGCQFASVHKLNEQTEHI